ncbi:MAG: MFS transporter [Candidatus Kariarchaeaceae archaeon]|jgi:MFS family permease
MLSLSQFFGLSLWFAPNAVFDQLVPLYNLSDSDLSSISIAVIIGFVVGSLLSALLNLPDVIQAQKLFFLSGVFGGIANILIIFTPSFATIWLLRFLTGVFLAGIYPVGMKLTASHFKENRGLAVGILLSALTAGSGLPYLFNLFGEPDWKVVLVLVSIQSIVCGFIVLIFITEGPFLGPTTKFQMSAVRKIYSSRSVRLANYGYFGHMWELYAFWVWIPFMMKESYELAFPDASDSEITQFFSIGSFLVFFTGALANIGGGYIADRVGRTKFSIIMLSISGTSSVIIGFMFSKPYLVLLVAIIWGITIIPDSPQYSTMVSEVSDQSLVGSALTIQTAIGFALTSISVQLLPHLKSAFGWETAFVFLAPGPILGIIALIQLRREPDAIMLAQGNK